jgi:Uma2 family endonuclease
MATANLHSFTSVEEYLTTTYHPDVDYVDGSIEERNLGEFDHGDLQAAISTILRVNQKHWGIRVVVETRVQIAKSRFRVPDVCVLSAVLERERIILTPPLLCVEVLSPRDTMKAMRKRAQDFFDMGVQTIWIIEPETRTAFVCTATEMVGHQDGILSVPGTKIDVAVEDIFSTLDA